MSESLRVNHVRVAGRRYDDIVEWLRVEHGLGCFEVVPLGGQRFRQGIAPLVGLTALELFGDFDDGHPFADAVARSPSGIAFVGWALRTDDIDAVAERVGKPAAAATSWVDARGEAFTARWLMSGPTIGLPYFIQYLAAPPAWPRVDHARPPGRLRAIEIVGTGDDLENLRRWVSGLDFEIRTIVEDVALHIVAVDLDADGDRRRLELRW